MIIDISKIVEHVKQHNLLFYPVIIYCILKALKQHAHNYKHKEPAFIVMHNNNEFSVVQMTYSTKFASFFNEYVNTCYQCLQTKKDNYLPSQFENNVLISFLAPEQMQKFESEMPIFYLTPLDNMQKMEISTAGFLENINWQKFTEELQNICTLCHI